MDPLSQATIGTIFVQAKSKKQHIKIASIVGMVSGLLPDIDVLISSASDPLLALEFHRQFTHSLVFIPLGALIVSFCFYYVFKRRIEFKYLYLYSLIGYATHGFLDSATSYGTQLFWPFSNMRVSWNIISIIDPLFTLPLVILASLCLIKRNTRFAIIAVIYCFSYLGLGTFQHYRAKNIASLYAIDNAQITVQPSFANLIVWKLIYSNQDTYYVSAAHLALKEKIYPGEKIKKLNILKDLPWIKTNDLQYQDIERFSWFSQGYISIYPEGSGSNFIGDMRYSLLPNNIKPLWGIKLNPDTPNEHVTFYHNNKASREQWKVLFRMILGRDINY